MKGYAWYRYSGLHHLVERFKPAALFLAKTRSELGAEAPTHVLRHFRAACKAYLAHLPGAGFLVDRAFDSIDDAVDAHAQEANAIIATACHKVSMIVARKRDAPDGNSAVEIMSIARQLAKDLGALGVKAGQPLAQNLDLENRSAQLKAASTAAFDMAKSKSAEVSQKLAGATEKVNRPILHLVDITYQDITI
jgi:HPt (histidine-containing phosphotransfer) domain-containing protein